MSVIRDIGLYKCVAHVWLRAVLKMTNFGRPRYLAIQIIDQPLSVA